MRTHSNRKVPTRAVKLAAVVAVLGFAATAVTTGAAFGEQRSGDSERAPRDQVIVGTGPHAVYVGSAPRVGGDPARGETEETYYARTSHHLPGPAAAPVDGPWWYGAAPLYGGDPASGETEDSYHARTGQHLDG